MEYSVHHGEDSYRDHRREKVMARYITVRNRAAGSSSVHFGPFLSIEAAQAFIKQAGVGMSIIELVGPTTDPETWWDR